MLWWVARKKQENCLHGERCVCLFSRKKKEDKLITLKVLGKNVMV